MELLAVVIAVVTCGVQGINRDFILTFAKFYCAVWQESMQLFCEPSYKVEFKIVACCKEVIAFAVQDDEIIVHIKIPPENLRR